jgi:hypothetical protein
MAYWGWIVLAIAIIAVVALTAVARRRETVALRRRRGPEYERTLQAREDRREDEADLRE